MFTVVSPKAPRYSHLPPVSSPLATSSPPRPSSPRSSSCYDLFSTNNRHPTSQSSPIRGSACAQSRFAARPVKKVPLARSRQEAQDSRRKVFLQDARRRADERAWQRRDIEGFTIKESVVNDTIRYHAAATKIVTTDADIHDAEMHAAAPQEDRAPNLDDLMAFEAAMYEEMALEAQLANMLTEQTAPEDDMIEDDDFDQALLALDVTGTHPGGDGMDMSC